MGRKSLARLAGILLLISAVSPSLAEGQLTIMQESYYETHNKYRNNAFIAAEVENTGDETLAFEAGKFELLDAAGGVLLANEWVTMSPSVLNPGDRAYVNASISLDDLPEGSLVDKHVLTIAKGANYGVTNGRNYVGSVVYHSAKNPRYEKPDIKNRINAKVLVDIENTQAATLYDFGVLFVVKDAGGKLMFFKEDMVFNVGIKTGSTLEIRDDIDMDTSIFFEEKGIEPSIVEVIVYQVIR
ncbi:MAG: hypothetical protein AB9880_11770 [Christensenellales bacterium]